MAQVAFPRFEKAINPLVKLQKKKYYNQIEEYFIEAKDLVFTAGFCFLILVFFLLIWALISYGIYGTSLMLFFFFWFRVLFNFFG